MGSSKATPTWLATTLAFTLASLSVYVLGKKWRGQNTKVQDLEKALKVSLDKCAAERQGRIRAQQALRKALVQQKTDDNVESTSYPMIPIGIVQSCFSTRNGTPRQPLLVPLARACLIFDPARVPPASLEGLEEYSHIWILYVFHLNTDLEKLWLEPSRSKIKAKVRVPRLKGGKKGVFATRSPHRPCPIGLTVAKVEAVHGHMILLSGVDLVDGTPILDVKPYLSYCDSIQESAAPEWVKSDSLLTVASVTFADGFSSALDNSWASVEKNTLYSSPSEMQRLIEQVLSWDIRSSSQRTRPHKCSQTFENNKLLIESLNVEDRDEEEAFDSVSDQKSSSLIVYHLILEGLDISYEIDHEGNVLVDSVSPVCDIVKGNQTRCNYSIWKDKVE